MQNRNYTRNEEKQIMSYNAYNLDNPIELNGWEMVCNVSEAETSFEGQIYKKDNDIVIVYKGSQEGRDYFYSDIQMVQKKEPEQQKYAHILLMYAQHKYPNANIELTGHSLGGSLAQIESAKTGISATTFNAYGTGEILKNQGYTDEQIKNMNVINYGNPKDPIFNSNQKNQPGKIFVTNTNLDPNQIYEVTQQGKGISSLKHHQLENMGDLSDAVEVTPESEIKSEVLNGYIYKTNEIYQNVTNPNLSKDKTWNTIPYADPVNNPTGSSSSQHIFTPEEIGKMSGEEFAKNEAVIMEQLRNGQIQNQSPKIDYGNYRNPESGNNRIFTREDIEKMPFDEYTKHEKEIQKQIQDIGLPYKKDLPHNTKTFDKEKNYSTNPKDGKWVTINGNHVFIEK